MRFFIKLAYNGTNFAGWQIQPNAYTVQECIEENISKLLGTDTSVTAAGRTDAGVHASEMYAHFDDVNGKLGTDILRKNFLYALNKMLPPSIVINKLIQVHDDAHARFSATSRSYQYFLTLEKNVFKDEFSWYWNGQLDIDTMNKAASYLLGKQDFQCFSKVHTDVTNFICEITEAKWSEKDGMLVFNISANRFLRNMVRAIVGTLHDVGRGKLQPDDIKKVIESKSRSSAGTSVPAKGLFLSKIIYPSEIFITK